MSAHNIHIRQLILNEFRAGRSAKEARTNINSRVNNKSQVSSSKVLYWYKKFRIGQCSITNKGGCMISETAESSSSKQETLSIHPNLLFKSTDKRFTTSMITLDGRYLLFHNSCGNMILLDLFHGITK